MNFANFLRTPFSQNTSGWLLLVGFASKYMWKMLRFYWILMDICLPKFDICQGTVDPNCFKSHAEFWYFDFFQKKNCLMSGLKLSWSDVTSFLLEIYIQFWPIYGRKISRQTGWRSFANFVQKQLKIMTFETLLKLPEDMLHLCYTVLISQ